MALDRQSIEKKDFPVGRRGYDPEAVDAHLAAVAEEVADLRRSARRRSDTFASSASEQVRAIVEAAETSANDIQSEAESDAREIRDEANSEAQATREQAADQAREYVGKVSESTSGMLQRLDAMESELGAMIESLRTGSDRLNADLNLLEGSLGEVSAKVTPRPRFEAEPETDDEPTFDAVPGSDPEPEPGLAPDPEADVGAADHDVADVAPNSPSFAAREASDQAGSNAPDDAAGVRLIALNMALNGTPQDETAKYLSENFQLADRDGLLAEVYASVEG